MKATVAIKPLLSTGAIVGYRVAMATANDLQGRPPQVFPLPRHAGRGPGWGRNGRRQASRPARRGFILLFGSRAIASNDNAPPVRAPCPRCGRETEMISRGVRHWFTVFFIPIFPISGRKHFTQCTECGAQFQLPARELQAKLAASEQASNQRAIALYNGLRASPGNSVALLELLSVYASMGEYDQAISAANEFPQALQSSEHCLTTLGRVYLAKNDLANAARWFEAALAKNPNHGEAHYFRAVAKMLSSPPDYPAAIASARAARTAGHAEAANLLRDLEAKARGEGKA